MKNFIKLSQKVELYLIECVYLSKNKLLINLHVNEKDYVVKTCFEIFFVAKQT